MKLSRKQIAILVVGSAAFGVSMAARDEVSGVALRALVAGLGWIILGVTLMLFMPRTARRS